MGTKLVRVLVAEAAEYLNDETNVMWSNAKLQQWLNYAENGICALKPEAYSKTATRQLAPGLLQDMAPDAVKVGTPIMNMGTDGLTPGRAITHKTLDVMNMIPTWATATAATEIHHFIRIPGDDLHFYVSPPVHETTEVYIQEAYPASPPALAETDFTSGTATINLPDIYANILLDLMLFRACDTLKLANKETGPMMAQKSMAALSRAIQTLTGKSSADAKQRLIEAANE